MTEQETEDLIRDAKLTAPRITPTDVNKAIIDEQYYVFPRTTTTVCCLTLYNGFNVTGKSSAVSHENFKADIGRKVAFEHARREVWEILGALLADKEYSRRRLANVDFSSDPGAANYKAGGSL